MGYGVYISSWGVSGTVPTLLLLLVCRRCLLMYLCVRLHRYSGVAESGSFQASGDESELLCGFARAFERSGSAQMR